MLDDSGRRIVVVFFVNRPNAVSSRRAMDELLKWLYSQYDVQFDN